MKVTAKQIRSAPKFTVTLEMSEEEARALSHICGQDIEIPYSYGGDYSGKRYKAAQRVLTGTFHALKDAGICYDHPVVAK